MKKLLFKKQSAFYLLLVAFNTTLFAQNFTWKKGSNLFDGNGYYGTQGVPANTLTPGARNHATSWTDASGNFWLFGGHGYDNAGNYGYLNDLWRYNTSTNQWTWVKGGNVIDQVGVYGSYGVFAAGNTPGTRFGAASFIDANGNLYLFGGYGYDSQGSFGELNDMWVYNIALNQWKWVKGANTCYQTATYGTQGTSNILNVPGARYHASSWKDAAGNFWVFGGYGFNSSINSYLNDLWRYTPANNEWTWMKGSAALNQVGIYGNQGTSAPGNNPGSRSSAVSWTDATGNLWLLGGYGYPNLAPADLLSDLWRYNVITNQWTWIKGYNNSSVQQGIYGTMGAFATPNMPGARYDAITWADATGDLWLFGGYGYGTGNSLDYLNDLWRYDIGGNQWKWVKGSNTVSQLATYGTIGVNAATNIPGSRGAGSTWRDGSNNLWMFGGNGYNATNNIGRMNDLWKFDNCISPTVTIVASSNSVCVGKTSTLTASGANTYTWTGSAVSNTLAVTPLTSSTYTVYGADANECRDTTTCIITVLSLPTVTASTTKSVICLFEFVNLTAGGAITYTWSTSQIAQNISVGPLGNTNYTVSGSDANGCVNSAIVSQSVSTCTGIENNPGALTDEISIYPNPGNGEFTIHTDINEKKNLVIFDAFGKKVFEQDLETTDTRIRTDLSHGIYYYKVQNSRGQTSKGKITINE